MGLIQRHYPIMKLPTDLQNPLVLHQQHQQQNPMQQLFVQNEDLNAFLSDTPASTPAATDVFAFTAGSQHHQSEKQKFTTRDPLKLNDLENVTIFIELSCNIPMLKKELTLGNLFITKDIIALLTKSFLINLHWFPNKNFFKTFDAFKTFVKLFHDPDLLEAYHERYNLFYIFVEAEDYEGLNLYVKKYPFKSQHQYFSLEGNIPHACIEYILKRNNFDDVYYLMLFKNPCDIPLFRPYISLSNINVLFKKNCPTIFIDLFVQMGFITHEKLYEFVIEEKINNTRLSKQIREILFR